MQGLGTHRWASEDTILLELTVTEAKIQAAGILLQGNRRDAGRAAASLVDLPQLERCPASISRTLIDHETS